MTAFKFRKRHSIDSHDRLGALVQRCKRLVENGEARFEKFEVEQLEMVQSSTSLALKGINIQTSA